jgi:hypothetical protein
MLFRFSEVLSVRGTLNLVEHELGYNGMNKALRDARLSVQQTLASLALNGSGRLICTTDTGRIDAE